MKKYCNYYNGEDANFAFTFEGMEKEEAERIQAFILQDSHFIIDDPNVLDNLGKQEIESIRDRNFTLGNITVAKDPKDKGHYIITGWSKTKDFEGQDLDLRYCGNVYQGLNFIAVIGLVQDEKTKSCRFSEINWCYEKSVDPTRLTRHNIKNAVLGATTDRWDLEGGDVVYTVSEDFKITDNPTKAFKESKKEVKVKKR